MTDNKPDKIRETKKCPFCAEDILQEAKKCKYCGETIDVTLRAAEESRRHQQNNNGGINIVQQSSNSNQNPHNYPINFPHLAHALGTIFTLGWWGLIWILHYLFRDKTKYR